MEKVKLTGAFIPLVLGIAAFYMYPEQSLLFRVIGLLVALGISLGLAVQSEPGKVAFAFVRDARTEIRKVVWPTRQETIKTTMFVIVAVIIMGIALWLLDMFLAWAVRYLTG
ncbi:MAG: preprotein translocase subunit SecE [Thiohalomonadales bacterium]